MGQRGAALRGSSSAVQAGSGLEPSWSQAGDGLETGEPRVRSHRGPGTVPQVQRGGLLPNSSGPVVPGPSCQAASLTVSGVSGPLHVMRGYRLSHGLRRQ